MTKTVNLINNNYYRYLILESIICVPILIFCIFFCAPSIYSRYESDLMALIFSEVFIFIFPNFIFFSELIQFFIIYYKYKNTKFTIDGDNIVFERGLCNEVVLRHNISKIEIHENLIYFSFLGNLLKIYYDKNKKYIYAYQAYDTDLLNELNNDNVDLVYKKSLFPFLFLINNTAVP